MDITQWECRKFVAKVWWGVERMCINSINPDEKSNDARRASIQKKREIKDAVLSEMWKVRLKYEGIVYSGY